MGSNFLPRVVFLALPLACGAWALPSAASGQNQDRQSADVDTFIESVREDFGIPGIALAIVQRGEVVHRRCYGFASLEHEVPVRPDSLFPLYSLTKPIIATGVFQLEQEEELGLDDPVGDYVPDLPDAWQGIELKHLLTHSSGLPDMAAGSPYEIRDDTLEEAKARTFPLPIRFRKGARYEYNQSNFWLLKEVIEAATGGSLEEFVLQGQFENAAESGVLFSHDARDIVPRRVTPYFPWRANRLTIDLPYTNGDYFLACNGLHLSLDEFLRWDRRLRANELLEASTKARMWTHTTYTDDERLFAFGWGVVESESGPGYGFSGSMSTIYRTYPEADLSIIFLSNGFTRMYSQDALVERIRALVR